MEAYVPAQTIDLPLKVNVNDLNLDLSVNCGERSAPQNNGCRQRLWLWMLPLWIALAILIGISIWQLCRNATGTDLGAIAATQAQHTASLGGISDSQGTQSKALKTILENQDDHGRRLAGIAGTQIDHSKALRVVLDTQTEHGKALADLKVGSADLKAALDRVNANASVRHKASVEAISGLDAKLAEIAAKKSEFNFIDHGLTPAAPAAE